MSQEDSGEKKIEWLHKSFVTEWPEIKKIITTLTEESPDSEFIRLQLILGKYQEQPQLLDTHLAEVIQRVTQLIITHYEAFHSNELQGKIFIMKCFSLIYIISKVRGYKAILKYFPHEVARVEQLFHILRYFSLPENITSINIRLQEDKAKTQGKSSSFSTVTSVSNNGQVLKFAAQAIFDTEIWHAEYVACLWLSVAILVPFSLSIILSVNNNNGDNNSNSNIINDQNEMISSQIREWCQNIIYRPDISSTPTLTSSALLLSKLLLRADLHFEVENFLQWSISMLRSPLLQTSNSSQLLISILTLLSFVLKGNSRNVLLNYSHLLKEIIEIISSYTSKGVTQRNLVLKVCGRIAICYLAPKRVRSWHYRQQSQSLLANLSSHNINGGENSPIDIVAKEEGDKEEEVEEELEEEVQGIVEQVTGILIQGIKDTDTKIRWSSSKRLSYLAERLPLSFTDQIIEFILNLFDPLEDDAAWHGGCLALAEMARRGVLALHRLQEATEKLFQAFEYDIKVGNTGKGANVRDAACYVAWAFARSFDQFILKDYIPQLTRALILMSLFDREVNCRRAAAAAFQENVGRQGGPACINVPHGIDIINIADYFSIGNRRDSYLNIAPTIARFDEYQIPILDHIVDFKIFHWDSNISQLAAESLAKLTHINSDYVINFILPKIAPLAGSSKFEYRFGGILSISEILLALKSQNLIDKLSDQLISDILSIIPMIFKNVKLLRRRGNKMIMTAICHLIHAISVSQIPIPLLPDPSNPSRVTIDDYEKVVYDSITHLNDEVQLAGVHCLRSFSTQYQVLYDKQKKIDIIEQYTVKLAKDTNVQVRRGISLALGAISPAVHLSTLPVIIRALIDKISGKRKEKDAEVRRNSIESLLEICKKNDIFHSIGRSQVHSIVRCFLKGLEDYSADNRGDVGSWIREASILSLCQISHLLCIIDHDHFDKREMSDDERKNTEFFTAKMCSIIFTSLLKQAVEKFDRIRDVAINAILFLLYSEDEKYIIKSRAQFALRIRQQNRLDKLPQFHQFIKIKYIPHYEKIIATFDPIIHQTHYIVNWSIAQRTFRIFVKFLLFEEFHFQILTGLVLSVGGISKAVVQESTKALLAMLESDRDRAVIHLDNEKVQPMTFENKLATSLILVGKKFAGNETNFLSFLRTVNLLFENQYLLSVNSSFSMELFQLIETDIAKTNDINKLKVATSTLIHLLLFSPTTRNASIQLILNLLLHSFPLIRQNTSENLYLFVITYDDIFENSEDISAILSETNWLDTPPEELVSAKERLQLLI